MTDNLSFSHVLSFAAGAAAAAVALHLHNAASQTVVRRKPSDIRTLRPPENGPSSSLRKYSYPFEARKISSFADIRAGFKEVQDYISSMITVEGSTPPLSDHWKYEKGSGGGVSNVWESHDHEGEGLMERGGVLYSAIGGDSLPPAALTRHHLPPGMSFQASGVSLVLHPHNPHIPTIHMNIRYLETSSGKWWFGGGIDVTPYYPQFYQIFDFHKRLEVLCESFHLPYEQMKRYCDKYFVNHHRGEMRGVGGIFFEDMSEPSYTKQHLYDFCVQLAIFMVDYYSWVVQTNSDMPYTAEQRDFQLIRRSRYVEFNLLHDRGTKFGLQAKGRVESIFCSLPAEARWRYDYQPPSGSREEFVVRRYLRPQNWVSLQSEDDLEESEVDVTPDPTSL